MLPYLIHSLNIQTWVGKETNKLILVEIANFYIQGLVTDNSQVMSLKFLTDGTELQQFHVVTILNFFLVHRTYIVRRVRGFSAVRIFGMMGLLLCACVENKHKVTKKRARKKNG